MPSTYRAPLRGDALVWLNDDIEQLVANTAVDVDVTVPSRQPARSGRRGIRDMKTVDLTTQPLSVMDLLRIARDEVILVKTEDGDAFVISLADDLDAKVQLLRQHHGFLTMLDEFEKEEETIPIEEAERRLR